MQVFAHEAIGLEGNLIRVEVDVRRGIPGVDLVGLAEGAVREARERVRAAVRNSGFDFPLDHILVSLAPAGIRKDGAAYDLPIALAVLGASGRLPEPGFPFMAMGELRLDGGISPVSAVLPAIAAGLKGGLRHFVVPEGNAVEASALGQGSIHPIRCLSEAVDVMSDLLSGKAPVPVKDERPDKSAWLEPLLDFSDIKGLGRLRRAMEIAAAGGHNLLLFGPPGSGKTMAARRFPSLLPDLSEAESVELSSLYSLAGLIEPGDGLLRRPPFRSPHHGSSLEGLIGGGRHVKPGEVSLAHRGVLFLDEAPEFHRDALQSLREPLEEGRVSLARAGKLIRFPASFQLILAANPCPCGNWGRPGKVCLCSPPEMERYWKKLGAPLMDRIDIRVPVRPIGGREMLGPRGDSSDAIRQRVAAARRLQSRRYQGMAIGRNSEIPPGAIERFCRLSREAEIAMASATDVLSLSTRACHSILKTALSIADMKEAPEIDEESLLEAVQHRRYGDGNFYWEKDAFL